MYDPKLFTISHASVTRGRAYKLHSPRCEKNLTPLIKSVEEPLQLNRRVKVQQLPDEWCEKRRWSWRYNSLHAVSETDDRRPPTAHMSTTHITSQNQHQHSSTTHQQHMQKQWRKQAMFQAGGRAFHFFQHFDTVGRLTGTASGLQKTSATCARDSLMEQVKKESWGGNG